MLELVVVTTCCVAVGTEDNSEFECMLVDACVLVVDEDVTVEAVSLIVDEDADGWVFIEVVVDDVVARCVGVVISLVVDEVDRVVVVPGLTGTEEDELDILEEVSTVLVDPRVAVVESKRDVVYIDVCEVVEKTRAVVDVVRTSGGCGAGCATEVRVVARLLCVVEVLD